MVERFGYAGKALRVDLTSGVLSDEHLDDGVLHRFVGGTGLGMYYLYREVSPDVVWCDSSNRLGIWSGPLGGTRASGSGTVSVVAKGAMTNMVAATQANGYLGAFLRSCGYDGIIFQGSATNWVYLHIDDNGAELRDAQFLLGKDTWEIEDAIAREGKGLRYSVFGIGPAGEHLVRFAALVGDRGHVAAHGIGAVLGSKKVKAIAVARGKHKVAVFDGDRLSAVSHKASQSAIDAPDVRILHLWGTGGMLPAVHAAGYLPVKNYTTSIFPEHTQVNSHYTREHFENRKTPCWACRISCCRITKVTEGPHAGFVGDEPELEGFAACGSAIGQTDPGATVMLANLIDRLGLDINESGWVMGFAMECYERGLLTKADTGGLELTWGNAKAAETLLWQVAHREGFGELFADGVQAAAQRIGGEALSIGIYTLKGNTPRSHDHRAKWDELLDTCVSNTGTIECAPSGTRFQRLGIERFADRFSWQQVSTWNARINGWRQWIDSLGICIFNFLDPSDLMEALEAATGWQLRPEDGLRIGRRIVNMMRVFNVRCGLNPDIEVPSPRYGSTPVDGPAASISIATHWDEMRRNYYRGMGWDETTGRPTPDTLAEVGLEDLMPDLSAIATP